MYEVVVYDEKKVYSLDKYELLNRAKAAARYAWSILTAEEKKNRRVEVRKYTNSSRNYWDVFEWKE